MSRVMCMPMRPQVLMGFDVDSCACGYDGQTLVLHPAGTLGLAAVAASFGCVLLLYRV